MDLNSKNISAPSAPPREPIRALSLNKSIVERTEGQAALRPLRTVLGD